MSFPSEDRFNPDNPLSYAPRVADREANSDSVPQTRAVRYAPSELEEMFEAARRYPLQPTVMYAPERRRPFFSTGRLGLAIGVAAIMALGAFILAPKFSRASHPESSAGPEFRTMNTSDKAEKIAPEESRALLQKFEQFGKSHDSAAAETAKATPNEAPALLGKFVQWEQRK